MAAPSRSLPPPGVTPHPRHTAADVTDPYIRRALTELTNTQPYRETWSALVDCEQTGGGLHYEETQPMCRHWHNAVGKALESWAGHRPDTYSETFADGAFEIRRRMDGQTVATWWPFGTRREVRS